MYDIDPQTKAIRLMLAQKYPATAVALALKTLGAATVEELTRKGWGDFLDMVRGGAQ